MSEAEFVRACYERVVAADFPHAGEIGADELRVKAVRREDCHGNSQNLLFFSFRIEERRFRDLKYECRYCDPTMYVAAELVSELIAGESVERLSCTESDQLANALGGHSRRVLRLAQSAMRLLEEAVEGMHRTDD